MSNNHILSGCRSHWDHLDCTHSDDIHTNDVLPSRRSEESSGWDRWSAREWPTAFFPRPGRPPLCRLYTARGLQARHHDLYKLNFSVNVQVLQDQSSRASRYVDCQVNCRKGTQLMCIWSCRSATRIYWGRHLQREDITGRLFDHFKYLVFPIFSLS